MNDTRTASLVMIAGAVGVGYWYYHLKHGNLAAPALPPTDIFGKPTAPSKSSGSLGPPVPLTGPDFRVGKIFKSDAEWSAAINGALSRYFKSRGQ